MVVVVVAVAVVAHASARFSPSPLPPPPRYPRAFLAAPLAPSCIGSGIVSESQCIARESCILSRCRCTLFYAPSDPSSLIASLMVGGGGGGTRIRRTVAYGGCLPLFGRRAIPRRKLPGVLPMRAGVRGGGEVGVITPHLRSEEERLHRNDPRPFNKKVPRLISYAHCVPPFSLPFEEYSRTYISL